MPPGLVGPPRSGLLLVGLRFGEWETRRKPRKGPLASTKGPRDRENRGNPPATTARYRTMLRRRSNDVADRGPGCRELATVQGLKPIWMPSSDVIAKVIWSPRLTGKKRSAGKRIPVVSGREKEGHTGDRQGFLVCSPFAGWAGSAATQVNASAPSSFPLPPLSPLLLASCLWQTGICPSLPCSFRGVSRAHQTDKPSVGHRRGCLFPAQSLKMPRRPRQWERSLHRSVGPSPSSPWHDPAAGSRRINSGKGQEMGPAMPPHHRRARPSSPSRGGKGHRPGRRKPPGFQGSHVAATEKNEPHPRSSRQPFVSS